MGVSGQLNYLFVVLDTEIEFIQGHGTAGCQQSHHGAFTLHRWHGSDTQFEALAANLQFTFAILR